MGGVNPYLNTTYGERKQGYTPAKCTLATKKGATQIRKKFTRLPNKYVQCDIQKAYGVSRKFYITYLTIDRYCTIENYSWITIRKILSYYGYKTVKNRPKAFYEVLDVLEFMVNNKMITIGQDLDSLFYDTGIEIEVIPSNFYSQQQWSLTYANDLDVIMVEESTVNKDVLLLSYLYINSYINTRQTAKEMEFPEQYPQAFYKNLSSMAQDIAMSKSSIEKSLKELEKKGLLIKETVGSIKHHDHPPKNVPNIYVLNKEGYQQEIKWALQKLKEIYKVEHFENPKGKTNT